MAEAASSAPGSAHEPFDSLKIKQRPPQRRIGDMFQDTPSTSRPSASPSQGMTPTKEGLKSRITQPVATPPRAQGPRSSTGPVFSPARAPPLKSSPSLPRRSSYVFLIDLFHELILLQYRNTNGKAWSAPPPPPPTASTSPPVTSGMSFVAIQQLQIDQAVPPPIERRSLLEIQEQEQARRTEEEFLRWWQEEEERVRLETEIESSKAAQPHRNPRKPRKSKARSDAPNRGEEAGKSNGPRRGRVAVS